MLGNGSRLIRMSLIVLVLAATRGGVQGAWCAEPRNTDPQGQAAAQSPSLINGAKLDLGYQRGLDDANANQFYYRLEYRGKLLKQEGTPISAAAPNSPPPAPEAFKPTGDTNNLVLNLERGAANLGGGFLDILSLPVEFKSGALQDLRGVLRASGTLDGKQLNLAAGLEGPPFHPLAGVNKQTKCSITNWLIFGLAGQAHYGGEDAGKQQQNLAATYRFFVGRGFDWVRSKKLDPALRAQIMAKAPNLVAAKGFLATPEGRSSDKKSAPVAYDYIYQASEAVTDEEYLGKIDQLLKAETSPPDQPSSALWVEGAGWYNTTGRLGDEPRYSSLLAATATWWPQPQEGGKQRVALRYELGRERAAPEVRLNRLILSISAAF